MTQCCPRNFRCRYSISVDFQKRLAPCRRVLYTYVNRPRWSKAVVFEPLWLDGIPGLSIRVLDNFCRQSSEVNVKRRDAAMILLAASQPSPGQAQAIPEGNIITGLTSGDQRTGGVINIASGESTLTVGMTGESSLTLKQFAILFRYEGYRRPAE